MSHSHRARSEVDQYENDILSREGDIIIVEREGKGRWVGKALSFVLKRASLPLRSLICTVPVNRN